MSKPPAPSDTADKFMLRLPDGMRDRLKTAAEENNRSMNAEIVSRLQQSLDDGISGPQVQSDVEKILFKLATDISIKTTSKTLSAIIKSGYSAADLSDEKIIRILADKIFSPDAAEVDQVEGGRLKKPD